jgi:hypothetical protein
MAGSIGNYGPLRIDNVSILVLMEEIVVEGPVIINISKKELEGKN